MEIYCVKEVRKIKTFLRNIENWKKRFCLKIFSYRFGLVNVECLILYRENILEIYRGFFLSF